MNEVEICARLSEYLKDLRERKNETQESLAKAMGVSVRTLARMEQRQGRKVVHALLVLNELAKLGDNDLWQFINYLLPDINKTTDGN